MDSRGNLIFRHLARGTRKGQDSWGIYDGKALIGLISRGSSGWSLWAPEPTGDSDRLSLPPEMRRWSTHATFPTLEKALDFSRNSFAAFYRHGKEGPLGA